MIDRNPPVGYERVTTTDDHTHYYLHRQPEHHGSTPLFMVMRTGPQRDHIMAERCLVDDGRAIVDALRLAYSIDKVGGW